MTDKEFNKIIKTVSKVTNIPEERILSETRQAEVVDARHMLIYVIYNHYRISSNGISKLVNKTRYSVCYAIRRIRDLIQSDDYITSQILEIKRKLCIESQKKK